MEKLTPRQAAKRAGVSLSLIYALCGERKLPHYRIGADGKRGRIVITTEDLDAFIDACRQERRLQLDSRE